MVYPSERPDGSRTFYTQVGHNNEWWIVNGEIINDGSIVVLNASTIGRKNNIVVNYVYSQTEEEFPHDACVRAVRAVLGRS